MSLVDPSPRPIGSFDVGPIGFGCWRFTNDSIDTATDWGGTGFGLNEEILGKVLANSPGLRDQMVLATMGGIIPPVPYDSGREYLTETCEASLRRLGVERIDLYQIHRPDFYAHPEELAETLTALRDAGKIGEVGISNYLPSQADALQAHLEFEIATGEGLPDELVTLLDSLADRECTDRAGIALAWILAHPSRPVALVGTQSPSRLSTYAAALEVSLDRADVYALLHAAEGVPLP